VLLKVHPTIPRLSLPTQRRLGSVLLPVPFTQNLGSIFWGQFKRVKARA
jgi:hypothetical protein